MNRFQSLLLTASQLVSFPAVTKTFQFTAFPILYGFIERSHSDIPGSKSTCDSPGHIVACHVLHRRLEPSPPPSSVVPKMCILSLHGLINMNFELSLEFCDTAGSRTIHTLVTPGINPCSSKVFLDPVSHNFLVCDLHPGKPGTFDLEFSSSPYWMDPSGFEPEVSASLDSS